MHFPQRLAHRAKIALIALGVFGEAMRQNNRPVDGPDHFERRNLMRIARQPVSTVGSLFGDQQARTAPVSAGF